MADSAEYLMLKYFSFNWIHVFYSNLTATAIFKEREFVALHTLGSWFDILKHALCVFLALCVAFCFQRLDASQ